MKKLQINVTDTVAKTSNIAIIVTVLTHNLTMLLIFIFVKI